MLERRVRFLGATALRVLSSQPPSYHLVLLDLRRQLGVPCRATLSTQDLEAEVFLHLLTQHAPWLQPVRQGQRPRRAAAIASGKSGDHAQLSQQQCQQQQRLPVTVTALWRTAVPFALATDDVARLGSDVASIMLLNRFGQPGLLFAQQAASVRTQMEDLID